MASIYEPNFEELKILSCEADRVFGGNTHDYALSSGPLEAALRYIVLSHRTSDNLEDIKPIKVILAGGTFCRINDSELDDTINEGKDCTLIKIFRSPLDNDVPEFQYDKSWSSLNNAQYPLDTYLSRLDSTGKYSTKTFIHNETRTVIILTANSTVNTKWIRALASVLFRMLPQYYPTIESAQEDKNFFWAISNLGSSATVKSPLNKEKVIAGEVAKGIFEEYVTKVCADLNFRDYVVNAVLKDWASSNAKAALSRAQIDYDRGMEQIKNYEMNLSELYRKQSEIMERLNLLKQSEGEGDNSFVTFFKKRKELSVISAENTYGDNFLTYSISANLEYYDEDELTRILNNQYSYLNNNSNEMRFGRKILRAIFLENRGVIRTQCVFTLVNTQSLRPQHSRIVDALRRTHLPHPHLVRYGCLGANAGEIQRFLLNGDWDMAIDQSISACKNLNFSDSTVISGMLCDLWINREAIRCIILPDGREMTPIEFVDMLDSENENEQNDEVSDNE